MKFYLLGSVVVIGILTAISKKSLNTHSKHMPNKLFIDACPVYSLDKNKKPEDYMDPIAST
jgi:hypothetical protein